MHKLQIVKLDYELWISTSATKSVTGHQSLSTQSFKNHGKVYLMCPGPLIGFDRNIIDFGNALLQQNQ